MQNKKSVFPVLIMIFLSFSIRAQDIDPIKDIMECVAENLTEDYDLSELAERLNYYRKHPLDLNKTTPLQLKELVFLSALQISNLFEHLKRNGKLLDVLELQAVDGFDSQTINRLLPFVMLKSSSALSGKYIQKLYNNGNNDLIIRYIRTFQTQKGFRDLPGSHYLGTPDKLLLRYQYEYSDAVSASLVAEKDAGEYLLRKKTGADHLSFNISLYKLGKVKKLILGDYSLQFGQGLTLWSGFSFGKGPDVTSVAAKDMGLRPYHSANEASFFRGIASTVNLAKYIDFTPFISLRKLDASLKFSANGDATLQNINITGLHRTGTELKNQKDLNQLVYGAALQYLSNNLNLGFVGYQSRYQHEFITGTQLYNKYGFIGKNLTNAGFHYNYTLHNIYLYGETAYSFAGGWAVVNGAMASLSSKVSAVLLLRNYDKDYHNFLGAGVGEATEISNEKGIYAGLNYMPSKHWTFSAYGDYFKFPWLKYRVDSASSGYEILGQVSYFPVKAFKLVLRYKREVKQQNPDAGSSAIGLQQVKKQNLRLEANWQLNKSLICHFRAEVSNYHKEKINEIGYVVYHDLDVRPFSSSISGNFRLAYFNTPSYNSRIYAYEDDVLYGSGSGIYSNNGFRGFLNLRYRVTKQIDVWTRYALYWYLDKETIGSGLDEINGNTKSDIKVQIRYQF